MGEQAATVRRIGEAHEPTVKPVVVYDGECPFCRRQIQKIRGRDRRGVFEYVPRQAEGLERRFPRLAEGDFNTGMRHIRPDGTIDVGADAVYQIFKRLPGGRWWTWLYRVPGLHWLANRIYAWIAQNRYKLAGKCTDDTCDL